MRVLDQNEIDSVAGGERVIVTATRLQVVATDTSMRMNPWGSHEYYADDYQEEYDSIDADADPVDGYLHEEFQETLEMIEIAKQMIADKVAELEGLLNGDSTSALAAFLSGLMAETDLGAMAQNWISGTSGQITDVFAAEQLTSEIAELQGILNTLETHADYLRDQIRSGYSS